MKAEQKEIYTSSGMLPPLKKLLLVTINNIDHTYKILNLVPGYHMHSSIFDNNFESNPESSWKGGIKG